MDHFDLDTNQDFTKNPARKVRPPSYTVRGYDTPTGMDTFSSAIEAIAEAKKLAERVSSWNGHVTVTKSQVVWDNHE